MFVENGSREGAEMRKGVAMPRMTEEGAWALAEEVEKSPPHVDPSKARHVPRMVALDDFSADYLCAKKVEEACSFTATYTFWRFFYAKNKN